MRFQFGAAQSENYTEGVTNVTPIGFAYDATADDSDKSFTVPDGEMWKIIYANVGLTTSATVGNRQLRLSITDPKGNAAIYISAGSVQAASLTRNYVFLQGIYRETSFVDSMIQVPIPIDMYLPSGSTIRFWESAAIAPTTDDMIVNFGYQRFKGC